jgi:hypothetical protein
LFQNTGVDEFMAVLVILPNDIRLGPEFLYNPKKIIKISVIYGLGSGPTEKDKAVY